MSAHLSLIILEVLRIILAIEHHYRPILSNRLRTERLHRVPGLYTVVISFIINSWLH